MPSECGLGELTESDVNDPRVVRYLTGFPLDIPHSQDHLLVGDLAIMTGLVVDLAFVVNVPEILVGIPQPNHIDPGNGENCSPHPHQHEPTVLVGGRTCRAHRPVGSRREIVRVGVGVHAGAGDH